MVTNITVSLGNRNLQSIPEREFLGIFCRIVNNPGIDTKYTVISRDGEFLVTRNANSTYTAQFPTRFPFELQMRILGILSQAKTLQLEAYITEGYSYNTSDSAQGLIGRITYVESAASDPLLAAALRMLAPERSIPMSYAAVAGRANFTIAHIIEDPVIIQGASLEDMLLEVISTAISGRRSITASYGEGANRQFVIIEDGEIVDSHLSDFNLQRIEAAFSKRRRT